MHPAVKGIGGILKGNRKKADWIIEGLEKGHQFVIGAGPQNRQIFVGPANVSCSCQGANSSRNVPKERRVLYINFELSGREQAERVVRMVGGEDICSDTRTFTHTTRLTIKSAASTL